MYILTHWGRETHTYVGKLLIIGSDNDLSPARRQAIIWTNDGILLIGPLGTNFNDTLIEINTFSFIKNKFKNVVWKLAAILSRPQCANTDASYRAVGLSKKHKSMEDRNKESEPFNRDLIGV